METREILEKVRRGELGVEEAESLFSGSGFEEMGYAKLDTGRKSRSGFPEVIYCEGKRNDYLVGIVGKMLQREGEVFGTRASAEQYEVLQNSYPHLTYDPVSRILKYEKPGKEHIGKIAVCTAGTADIPVAEEAALTAEFFGAKVERVYDVGVRGIHRLFAHASVLQEANCVVVVAGMEGALASVVGGMVKNPVIAVPTSVGYGANFHGLSALLTMLNSCANGISVVNIDNGYGAGYLATQINRLACRPE
jgi:NCAIR mutase (PurE)-related protein